HCCEHEYVALNTVLPIDSDDTFRSSTTQTSTQLENFRAKHAQQWMFRFFSYDLKNEIENLHTDFPDPLEFPNAYFFVPKILLRFTASTVEIDAQDPSTIYESIIAEKVKAPNPDFHGTIRARMSKADYMEAFTKMQEHIQRGDIYEVNLCQEFYAEDAALKPLDTYQLLNEISPTPF